MNHPDLAKLFSCLLPYVKQMLRRYGEVMPLSVVCTADQEIEFIGASAIEGDDLPCAEALIDIVIREFQDRSGSSGIVAAALCSDVIFMIPDDDEPCDAIRFHLEHLDGEVYTIYLPYIWGMHDELDYGELYVFEGEPAIFEWLEAG